MIDLDIPTNSPPQTSTLLHWLQTGLTSAETATMLNTTTRGKGGATQAFILQNKGNTAALAPYIGPSPPARIPLSHRYTQILVNHTGLSTESVGALQMAAATRQGFNAMQVLMQAGLMDKVVAGNFFNVTNAGPVNSTSTGGGGSSGMGSGRASGTMSMPTTTAFAGASGLAVPGLLGLVAAAAFFVGL